MSIEDSLTGFPGTRTVPAFSVFIFCIIFLDFICLFFSIIFAIHFGAMTVLFGAMVYLVTSLLIMSHVNIQEVLIGSWPAILALFISHGYSFLKNYYNGEERQKTTIRMLMILPYLRWLALLLALLLGSFLGALVIIKFGMNTLFLIFLIALKTFLDLISHLMERKKYAMAKSISNGIDNMSNMGDRMGQFFINTFINKNNSNGYKK